MDEERTLNRRPLLAALFLVLAIGTVWAATALAGGGSPAGPKSAPAGDGAGKAYIKAKAGARHHAGSDGNCPGRARSGRGVDASAAV